MLLLFICLFSYYYYLEFYIVPNQEKEKRKKIAVLPKFFSTTKELQCHSSFLNHGSISMFNRAWIWTRLLSKTKYKKYIKSLILLSSKKRKSSEKGKKYICPLFEWKEFLYWECILATLLQNRAQYLLKIVVLS